MDLRALPDRELMAAPSHSAIQVGQVSRESRAPLLEGSLERGCCAVVGGCHNIILASDDLPQRELVFFDREESREVPMIFLHVLSNVRPFHGPATKATPVVMFAFDFGIPWGPSLLIKDKVGRRLLHVRIGVGGVSRNDKRPCLLRGVSSD